MRRRGIAIILTVWMLLASCPIVLPAFAEQPEPWDGSVADGFAGGSGSKEDPYLIETASQLAFLSQSVNAGTTYNDKYIRLTADICLNDETFTFEADTGLIKVTDTVNTAYLGTGILGNDSGKYTRFDSAPSTAGKWYDSEFMKTIYKGALNEWTPIGGSDSTFKGSFDAAGHRISGLYVNVSENAAGLFGRAVFSTIQNVTLENSVVIGNCIAGDIVGGIAGRATTVIDCSFSGIVLGDDSVGGVVGVGKEVYGSVFKGIVKGDVYVGGVAGDVDAVTLCRSEGTVSGYQYVGGVAGETDTVTLCQSDCTVNGYQEVGGVAGSTATASQCRSDGTVAGTFYIGGIVGNGSDLVNRCANYGNVSGTSKCVGGIVGSGTTIELCVNAGNVSGENSVGGVMGSGTKAERCSNLGTVQGTSYVGGILGSGRASLCDNRADVQGNKYVGGIVGSGTTIELCVNVGNVTGTNYVGGLFGNVIVKGYDSYNTGTVTGEQYVGGIAGIINSNLRRCYNVGTVSGTVSVGALVGNDKYGMVVGCYYLKGCATDGAKKQQNGVGSDKKGNVVADTDNEIIGLTDDMMRQQSSFGLLFFVDTDSGHVAKWTLSEEGYPYPTILGVHHADHVFDFKSEEKAYCKVPATCQESGISYYRCQQCDLSDLETYTTEKMGHVIGETLSADASCHWHACTVCQEVMDLALHQMDGGTVTLAPTAEKEGTVSFVCQVCQYQSDVKIPSVPLGSEGGTVHTEVVKSNKMPSYYPVFFILVGVVLGAVGFYTFITVKQILKERK